jgi:hypothetical protein
MGRINLGEPRNELAAENAVDGDEKTRWGSAFRDKQWLMVDLDASVPLSKVRLSWGTPTRRTTSCRSPTTASSGIPCAG